MRKVDPRISFYLAWGDVTVFRENLHETVSTAMNADSGIQPFPL